MKILVADDSPVDRHVIVAALKKWGDDEVLECETGDDALAILKGESPPPLAILDWMMPGMTGPEICQAIRHHESQRYIYTVLLTSKDDREDIVSGMEAGADDYVVKPVDLHVLQVRLRAGRRIIDLQDELIAAQEELRIQATRDYLTRVWNRAAIMDILERELERTRREGRPLSIVMGDVDHFKDVNDTYGHPAGDAVLSEVAQRIEGEIRRYDSAGRFGGEEFLIVSPNADLAAAHSIADRVRRVVMDTPIENADASLSVTISLGIATSPPTGTMNSVELIAQADQALYAAKAQGRNCVVASGELAAS